MYLRYPIDVACGSHVIQNVKWENDYLKRIKRPTLFVLNYYYHWVQLPRNMSAYLDTRMTFKINENANCPFSKKIYHEERCSFSNRKCSFPLLHAIAWCRNKQKQTSLCIFSRCSLLTEDLMVFRKHCIWVPLVNVWTITFRSSVGFFLVQDLLVFS